MVVYDDSFALESKLDRIERKMWKMLNRMSERLESKLDRIERWISRAFQLATTPLESKLDRIESQQQMSAQS